MEKISTAKNSHELAAEWVDRVITLAAHHRATTVTIRAGREEQLAVVLPNMEKPAEFIPKDLLPYLIDVFRAKCGDNVHVSRNPHRKRVWHGNFDQAVGGRLYLIQAYVTSAAGRGPRIILLVGRKRAHD